MSILFLDIETIPSQTPGALEAIRQTIKHPGNISKPDTVAKWYEEHADAVAEEQYRKQSFDGALGEIISIAWANDDSEINVNYRCDTNETKLLKDFFKALDSLKDDNGNRIIISRWCGHYISDFDLRFLWKRCVILGVRPPIQIPYDAKPWDDAIFDTKTQWTGSSSHYTGVGSLDALAKAFGLAGKDGDLKGSNVYDFWLAGRFEEIVEYNKNDVYLCRELFRRMNFVGDISDDF